MAAASPTPTVTDRMARGRRRVIAGAAAVFLAAWIAVIGVGQHAHASGQAAPTGTTVAPGGSDGSDGGGSGDGGSARSGADGGWSDGAPQGGGQDGGPQAGQTDGGQAEAPLTTSQS